MNNENVKFLLNWNHFGDHLSSCMTKLMTDTSYSDIIIATADKQMIYSHRFVLANSSKYFQKLLKHINRQTGIQLVVALPEIKYETFKILMNYMYKGETQVPHELLRSVIKAGRFLEINGLMNLNENENCSGETSLLKHNHAREAHPRCSIAHSKTGGNHGNESAESFGRMSSTLRDNVHPRENTHNNSKNVFPVEKKVKKQNPDDNHASEQIRAEENGKENRSKLMKSLKCKNMSREKKDFIQLPLKRKTSGRESIKKTSPVPSPSSSLSAESGPPKKTQKRHLEPQEIVSVKVKEEKENSRSPLNESECQDVPVQGERITIKMEMPDVIGEVVYNELKCEFCHEGYTNPSDWVKHMTDHHGDMGYQTYKEFDKNLGSNAMITCVVCSAVFFSAVDWAKHLQMWHTDREMAGSNATESKKNSKIKKKSGLSKKG